MRKNKSNDAKQSSTVPDTCVSTAVNALYNGLSKKASNFDRQLKRIEARLPKIESKRGKMTEYNQTMDDLVAANSSCPAGNQTEIDALIATLGECQMNIETACAVPMLNQTQIDECTPIVEGFVAEVEKCFGLNSDPAAACECWESDALAELYEGLKGCVIKPSEANVTDAFKACKTAVSTCNKAQAEAIPVLVACYNKSNAFNPEIECSPGFTKWQNKCYQYIETPNDWDDDGENCRSLHSKATLVSIQNQDENNHVYSLFNYKDGLNAWIGGYEIGNTKVWAWQDGSLFAYSNWASDEPNNVDGSEAIYMYGRTGPQPGRWNDAGTSVRIGYVCSYYL